MKGIGIIGAGLIGEKRAAHLGATRLIAICDPAAERAEKVAHAFGAAVEKNWESLIRRTDLDAVLVCTPHDRLAACAAAALRAGKHVLVEKPGGRNPQDIQVMIDAAAESKKVLRVGFNHRFHPGFQKAKALLQESKTGPLMYIRARYGHGGRPGYEKEWRADPAISGGGELLDQGVHLIDLCRWLGGEFKFGWGKTQTFFWPMHVEDNGFLYLESPDQKRSAFLHASWTEWKNLFDFELFTRNAKIEVFGLGKSYGTEELRIYRMKPEMGPPDMETIPFPGEDRSWQDEFEAFLAEIKGEKTDLATADDALRALEIVTRAYQLNSTRAAEIR
jgi:predicted dehydrogenase